MNKDLLFELHKIYGYDSSAIKDVVLGSVYNFISHSTHHIGVAATLGNTISEIPSKINFKLHSHRSFLLAYYNSIFNYQSDYYASSDLISEMKLKTSEKISMIGNFRPIVSSLVNNGFKPCVFDDFCEFPEVLHPSEKDSCINSSDVLIITATSIVNNSFYSEIQRIGANTRVFILGPSSLMIPYFKEEFGVERIFGSIIKDVNGVKNEILIGGGTQTFSKFIEKVMF